MILAIDTSSALIGVGVVLLILLLAFGLKYFILKTIRDARTERPPNPIPNLIQDHPHPPIGSELILTRLREDVEAIQGEVIGLKKHTFKTVLSDNQVGEIIMGVVNGMPRVDSDGLRKEVASLKTHTFKSLISDNQVGEIIKNIARIDTPEYTRMIRLLEELTSINDSTKREIRICGERFKQLSDKWLPIVASVHFKEDDKRSATSKHPTSKHPISTINKTGVIRKDGLWKERKAVREEIKKLIALDKPVPIYNLSGGIIHPDRDKVYLTTKPYFPRKEMEGEMLRKNFGVTVSTDLTGGTTTLDSMGKLIRLRGNKWYKRNHDNAYQRLWHLNFGKKR